MLHYKEKLILNGYPPTFLMQAWNIAKRPQRPKTDIQTWISMPYVNDENCRTINNLNRNRSKKFTFHGGCPLSRSLPSANPHIPNNIQSNVVYKIPCEPGCRMAYPGQTSRRLYIRINEHRGYINANNPTGSGLSNHAIRYNHTPDFANTTIIAHAKTTYLRRIYEQTCRDSLGQLAMNKINPRSWTLKERTTLSQLKIPLLRTHRY